MIQPRLAPLSQVQREVSPGEPKRTTPWTQIAERRVANMHLFVMDVAATGGLRKDVTVDEGANLVWVTNAPGFYLLLVDEWGWDPEPLEHWLTQLWVRTLRP